jgi:ABC-2 type transport system permease protein
MTASIVSSRTGLAGRASSRRLTGLGPLFRKELGEWTHSKRVWVILIVTALFMTLQAGNGALTSWIVANTPDATAPAQPISLVPLDNFLAAISSQIFVVVAIFAAMSLLVAERDHGTLAWVASKPVSRGAIWVGKWLAATVVVAVAAGVLPLLATLAVVTALYGSVSVSVVTVAAIGVVASIAFIIAVVLAASTVISNQPAVAAIGFAVFFLPQLIVGFLPADVAAFLPTSMMGWAIGLAAGADVGFVTPIALVASIVGLAAFASWRMGKMEL